MPPSEWRLDDHALTASRSLDLDGVRLAVRAALSAALALAIAQLARLPSPVFAMIGAVIVTDLSAAETRRVAERYEALWRRVTGTTLLEQRDKATAAATNKKPAAATSAIA